ncbi:hypothetical protein B0A50_04413 [Salinomyces thailandicus]|uniref:Uncharacterized protein n=1 Tax=Salinomyces thailandicus TaxID=706561 RepID=A0A4U0TYH6_9PEZI|nr:hypothetical protein B0A50_04413 [Salinomyces thailandica]
MAPTNSIRTYVLTASVAAITATGAWYGAGLKTRQEYKQERNVLQQLSHAQRLEQMEASKARLLTQRAELQNKIARLTAKDGTSSDTNRAGVAFICRTPRGGPGLAIYSLETAYESCLNLPASKVQKVLLNDGWAGRSPHRHALLGPHLNIEMLVKGRDPVSKLLANRFVTEHCKLYPIDRSKTLMDRRVHQHILAREHNGKVSMPDLSLQARWIRWNSSLSPSAAGEVTVEKEQKPKNQKRKKETCPAGAPPGSVAPPPEPILPDIPPIFVSKNDQQIMAQFRPEQSSTYKEGTVR